MKTATLEQSAQNARKARNRLILRLILLAAALAAVDGFFIEPYWIRVTHWTVRGNVTAPLKIAELADLHTSHLGLREESLLKLLDKEAPDVIVIAGDSISKRNGYPGETALLRRFHAPLGVWLVRGNWEDDSPLRSEHRYYESLGIHLLLNEGARIRDDVWLAGVDDPTFGGADLDRALSGAPAGAYTIALFHSPKFFATTAGRYNLALAGHSHGGQVHVPGLERLWLPRGVGPYVSGWFQHNGSRMYVSRGIGMTLIPVRFLCRPELPIITIEPVQK